MDLNKLTLKDLRIIAVNFNDEMNKKKIRDVYKLKKQDLINEILLRTEMHKNKLNLQKKISTRKKSAVQLEKEYIKVMTEATKMIGRYKRIMRNLPYEKDEEKQKEMSNEVEFLKKQINNIEKQGLKLKKQIEEKEKD